MRNTYEALDDASVSVMFALSELHDQFGCECFSNSPPCPRHVAPVSLPEPLQLLPAHFPPHHVYFTHCAGWNATDHGDHKTDSTAGKQHLAGFGWGRSDTDVGVEDFGFQHPISALICESLPTS